MLRKAAIKNARAHRIALRDGATRTPRHTRQSRGNPWPLPRQHRAIVTGPCDTVSRTIALLRNHMSPTKRPDPANELFPLMYGELRRVAGRYLGRERINHTLQPTALVNEAWLRMQKERGLAAQGRTQGLALAAQAMRRLLVDHGRHQKRQKRGGRIPHVELDELLQAAKT